MVLPSGPEWDRLNLIELQAFIGCDPCDDGFQSPPGSTSVAQCTTQWPANMYSIPTVNAARQCGAGSNAVYSQYQISPACFSGSSSFVNDNLRSYRGNDGEFDNLVFTSNRGY